ncbi:M23 family metallopeptidase [Desulfobacterota bacterium AH_259_B03_O07]|nr:M23 family metallopeptidase [Desulfobacterota bacterium AH_259_B03_O07]
MIRDSIAIYLFKSTSKPTKSFRIKLSYVKVALITLFGLALISLLSIIFTYKFYNKAETSANQKRELIHQLNDQSDELNEITKDELILKSRLIEIEEKLLEMEELLDRKGINKKLAAGGEYIPAESLDLSYFDNMERGIDELFNAMKGFPLGKPIRTHIESGFGYRKDPVHSKPAFHPGIDFDAKYGQTVAATADGIVVKAGSYLSYGRTVIINHQNGYQTLYGHLSKVTVKKGQKVTTGDKIGKAGSTGRSTGTHLHYEIIKGGKKLNPSKFLTLK